MLVYFCCKRLTSDTIILQSNPDFFSLTHKQRGLEQTLYNHADMSIDIMENVISEFVRQESLAVVRETCAEHVDNYIRTGKSHLTLDSMMDQLTADATRAMVC